MVGMPHRIIRMSWILMNPFYSGGGELWNLPVRLRKEGRRGRRMTSRPAVHPVDSSYMTNEAPAVHTVRMKDFQGMAGTTGGLLLRLCQFAFAVVSLCVMVTTSDFPSVTAFRFIALLIFIYFLPFTSSALACVLIYFLASCFWLQKWRSWWNARVQDSVF